MHNRQIYMLVFRFLFQAGVALVTRQEHGPNIHIRPYLLVTVAHHGIPFSRPSLNVASRPSGTSLSRRNLAVLVLPSARLHGDNARK